MEKVPDTVSTPDRRGFERAIAAYELGGIDVPSQVAAVGRASLDTTGLLLVGEAHGVEQTPRAVFALAHALDVDALGRQPRSQGGLEQRAGATGVAGHDDPGADPRLGPAQHPGRGAAEGQHQLGGELGAGQATDAVGASVESIAQVLFTEFALPFEIISLLLLVAIIGAIYLARRPEEDERAN